MACHEYSGGGVVLACHVCMASGTAQLTSCVSCLNVWHSSPALGRSTGFPACADPSYLFSRCASFTPTPSLQGFWGCTAKVNNTPHSGTAALFCTLQDQMLREQAVQAVQAEAPGSAAIAELQGGLGAAQPLSPTGAANSAAIAAIQRQAQLQLMATQHKEQQQLAAHQAGGQPWPTHVHPSQLHLLQAAQQQVGMGSCAELRMTCHFAQRCPALLPTAGLMLP